LLTTLTAVDARFGRAYGLGRALADTCRKPRNAKELANEFREHRIGNLRGWLDELSTALPSHSAHSVATSLDKWSTWTQQARTVLISVDDPKAPGKPGLEGPDGKVLTEEDVLARVHRQGDLWRAVIAGEKRPQETLELDNYAKAAGDSAKRMAAAARRVVWHFKLLSLLILALIVGGIALIVAGGPAKSVAGATSLLSAVGLTWKGLGGSLGKLAGKLEQPVWGAVIDLAVTDAITLLPNNMCEKGGRQDVAVQMAASMREEQKGKPQDEGG
jgi:hypothetical protein